MLDATNLMPFAAVVLWKKSKITSASIVGGKSSTIDVGSPADKMILPLGEMRYAEWSSAAEKDSCVSLATSCAAHTLSAHSISSLTAAGFLSAAAEALLVEPPIAMRRCYNSPAIRKKASK